MIRQSLFPFLILFLYSAPSYSEYFFWPEPELSTQLSERRSAIQRGHDIWFKNTYGGEKFFAFPTERGRMGPLVEATYAFLERNARAADLYFRITPALVVELGNRIDF